MAHCFTISANGRLRELVSECQFALAFDPMEPVEKHFPFKAFRAVWDTGATNSVISQRVVDECGLKPVGVTQVHNANAVHDCEQFLVNLRLPNGIGFAAHRVTKQNLHADLDALIGMDIIGFGDFAVTNKDGKTMFSFRVPSTEAIDFVKPKPVIVAAGQGRNERCHCQSGKKFKDCCGRAVAL